MNSAEFQALMDEAEEVRQMRDRADGARAELMKSLWEKFRCKSLKEARELLKKEKAKLTDQKELEEKETAHARRLIERAKAAGVTGPDGTHPREKKRARRQE